MADAPAWRVRGTKKGDWPIDVEKRKHHTVTVLRNVSGDVQSLCTELQDALGAGGTVRGSVVERQGAHTDRCIAFLSARRRHVAGVRAALLPEGDDDEETILYADETPTEIPNESWIDNILSTGNQIADTAGWIGGILGTTTDFLSDFDSQ